MLALSLLASSTPAAPRVVMSVLGELKLGTSLWLRSDGRLPRALALLGGSTRPSAARQETQGDRDSRIHKVKIFPEEATLRAGERAAFDAIGYDSDGTAVGGVKFTWTINNAGPGSGVALSDAGEFEADAPGEYVITAEGAGRAGRALVRVLGERPARGGGASGTSRRPLGKHRVSTASTPGTLGSSSPSKRGPSKRVAGALDGVSFVNASFAREPRASSPSPMPMISGDPYGWNERNYWSADDPVNERGNPPGRVSLGGASSHNFTLAAPTVSLPGRGLDLNLSLTYNSRVWNKSKSATVSEIGFDMDRDTPAPGWSLGFGKMLNLVDGGAMLIDPDGTRHGFEGDVFDVGPYATGVQSKTFIGGTIDGTFIEYSCQTNSFGGSGDFGIVKYPNGTVVWYSGAPDASGARILYPTRITDANGNYISIVRDSAKPDRPITSIIDTLGRVLTFHYDSNNLLTSIKAVGLPNESGARVERTLVRLHYKTLQLDYDFSADLTPLVRSNTVTVIDAIYYPDARAGYWFGDADSYSSYGMIAKVAEQHSMSFTAGASDDEQGTITPGVMSRQTVYNYPLTKAAGGTLSDAPAYDTATETWDGMDTDAPVTHYDLTHQQETPRKVTATRPDGTSVVETSYNAPDTYLDGLVYKKEVFDAANHPLYTYSTEFETGLASSPPRPHAIEITDERSQTLRTEYSYSTNFNNVAEVREYDYDASLTRRTVRTFLESPSYGYSNTGFNWDHSQNDRFKPYLTSVLSSESVYSGTTDDTIVAKKEYRYDEDPNPLNIPPGPPCYGCSYTYQGRLVNTPGVVQHSDTFDPYRGPIFPWSTVPGSGWNPNRGNLTSMVIYTDAKQTASAITKTLTLDITGNAVSAKGGGSEIANAYTSDTQYAYVMTQTRGPAGASARVTSGFTYDFYTGLRTSTSDANGRTSTFEYSTASWRMSKSTSATGAHTDFAVNDDDLSLTQTSYDAQGHVASQGVSRLNGQGQVRRTETLVGDNLWDVVETKYDKLSRIWKQTRPFRDGIPTNQWKWVENVYDALDRVTQSVAPDGSATLAEYNAAARPQDASGAPGKTVKITDPWGRERWGRTNSDGKFVEVVEPNPTGDGTVAVGGLITTYKYDTLGNMTEVNQGAQRRLFQYDSMSRLTRQKMAEANATLDDAGNLSTTNGKWSEAITYDERSNVVSRVDARGVKTIYTYTSNDVPDSLNRLLSIEYDASAAAGVLPSPKVSFSYMTAGDVTRLRSITTEGVSVEEFTYDAEARLQERTLTLLSRTAFPLTTSYTYDSLSRLTDTFYPKQYGSGLEPRKVVHNDFDVANRVAGLKVDGAEYASQIDYNSSGQAKSLLVGPAGPGRTTESYEYDDATGLLNRQKVTSAGSTLLLDLSYEYLRAGTVGGRTGQITRIVNNLDATHRKDRNYEYDQLGRLKRATSGDANAPVWEQNYGYDRYGNRTSVTASGYAAALDNSNSPARTDPAAQVAQIAKAFAPALPNFLSAGADQRTLSDGPDANQLFGAAFIGPFLTAPTDLKVTSATDAQIRLTWAASVGTVNYRVEKSTSKNGPYALAGTSTSNAFDDNGVSHGNAYLYKVCAADGAGNCVSSFSNVALGGAFTFADDPIVTQDDHDHGVNANQPLTKVSALHFTQLREAVNAVRHLAGRADATWTHPTLTPNQTVVTADDVRDLRTALADALTDLGIPLPGYTDATLYTGQAGTLIKRAHVAELRLGATRGQGGSSAGGGQPVPRDGLASVTYDAATNRITLDGYAYDAAGNLTRSAYPYGGWLRFQYDAAGRLAKVKDDLEHTLATYAYDFSSHRLVTQHGDESSVSRTYYAWAETGVTTEYREDASHPTSPAWDRSYIYLSTTLLATHTATAQAEAVEFYHPDRLGVRLVTTPSGAEPAEHVTLPFGTPLEVESKGVVIGAGRRAFTSYDRSEDSALDYAENRFYDWNQSRFTQSDPSGFGSSSAGDPQTLNLYAYCGNDPVNRTDPNGLDFTFGVFINIPGIGGGSARTGWLWLGGLAGLLQFGIGLFGWLFQRPPFRQPYITNAFTTFYQRPRQGKADPRQPPARHVSVAVYGVYDARTSTQWHEADNDVFRKRAADLAGDHTQAVSAGAAVIQSLIDLTRSVNGADVVAIFGHGHPPGLIGGTNQSEGLYISNADNTTAYHTKYDIHGEMKTYDFNNYFRPDRSPVNSAGRSVQDLANAILHGDINIAQGGEVRFYGCYTDAMASELQWNLTHVANGVMPRPDIRVTGFQGPANLGQNSRLTLGAWRTFYGFPQQETRGHNLGYR